MNSFLTTEQRSDLLNLFIERLDSIDPTFPVEELVENMMRMNNSEFYNECLEFIPDALVSCNWGTRSSF